VRYLGDIANDLAGGIDGLDQDRHSNYEGIRLDHFHVFGNNAIKLGLDESVENFAGNETIAYDTDANGNPIPTQFFTDDSAQRGSLLGAYVQDKWTPTRYVSVLGGLRYDHSTGYVSGAQLSPRLEFDGQFAPSDIFHAYYGRLYAAPFLEDTRKAADILGGVTSPTPYDLQPEHDSYYEFGLAHTFAPGTRATVNFWKRDVENVLDTTQLANTPIFAVFNNTIGITTATRCFCRPRSRNRSPAVSPAAPFSFHRAPTRPTLPSLPKITIKPSTRRLTTPSGSAPTARSSRASNRNTVRDIRCNFKTETVACRRT
jgi:hypothetical protein